jgi:hypothetical protein
MKVADRNLALSLLLVVALCAVGCGSGGGSDGGNHDNSTATTSEGGDVSFSQQRCTFGDGSFITLTVSGSNNQVAFCVDNGGTVSNTPDNSSTDDHADNHPNDQSGQSNKTTTTNNNPAPTGTTTEAASILRDHCAGADECDGMSAS